MTLLPRIAGSLLLLISPSAVSLAHAAEPAPAPTSAPEAGAAQATSPAGKGTDTSCYPPCRSGFLCHEGQCVSMCNPPCPADHVCVDGTRCELEGHMPVAQEPPIPPLPRRGLADRTYSAIGFHLGFSGSVERNGVSRDLDTTLGFNLRGDVPVFKYMLIGPLIQFGAWRPDSSGSRNYYLDVDLFVRGRIPVDLDSIGLQVWAGIPIGLSLSFLGNDDGRGLDGFGIGWNFGVMVGGAVHFSSKFGMFTEIGWLQHKMSHDVSSGGGGSADFRLSQGVWNVGFILGD